MAVVEASMHFLTRDEIYKTEKPYQLKYPAQPGIPKSNLRLEKQNLIKISSIRGQEKKFSFDTNGFAVLKMDKEIPYDDFNSPEGIRKYLDVVTDAVKVFLGASKVQAFQSVVRLKLGILMMNAVCCILTK